MNFRTIITVCTVVLILGVTYEAGYSSASDKYENEILKQKNEYQAQIILEQKKAKDEYEKKLKETVSKHRADIVRRDERLRQLERKLRTGADLDTVTSERNRALRLAVRGEELLKDAERIIETMK